MLASEKKIQDLICHHPYLLDDCLFTCCGKKEYETSSGRIDIKFETSEGAIIVECKKTELQSKDLDQIKRYISDLKSLGEKVTKAYLIGLQSPNCEKSNIIYEGTVIYIKHINDFIPSMMAVCQRGHYFDSDLGKCPYCGEIKDREEMLI